MFNKIRYKIKRYIIEMLFSVFAKRGLWLIKKFINNNGLNDKRLLDALKAHDLNVAVLSDYYSPLPDFNKLSKNINRWHKVSSFKGIPYNVGKMECLLTNLLKKYKNEYLEYEKYSNVFKKGFGVGFTALDSMILYFMLREIKPKRYIEIGSGVSTYYCSLAAERNSNEENILKITCIEPYPYERLFSIPEIEIIKKEVQDVDISFFDRLDIGDILFIDSSHIVKIDGDVPYLYLEVLPRLKKGVIVHIHDIPFPFNIPFPPELWVLGKYPIYWNEAMLVQAFLYKNSDFKIILSAPLMRYYNEKYLFDNVPNYETVQGNPYTYSSLWIEKLQ